MKRTMRFMTIAVAALMAAGATVAHAQDQAFEVRVRAVYLVPQNGSDAFRPLQIPSDAIHVDDKWLPDLDFEYFFTPHWSSELLLTYPQTQTVTVEHSVLGGPAVIGTFKQLPPSLLLKYDFFPEDRFQPYLGAGVNVTFISSVHLSVPPLGTLQLDRTSVGPAVQAGFDYALGNNWYFNTDVKWAMIRSEVKYQGVKVSHVRIDPYLFAVGVGYRFSDL